MDYSFDSKLKDKAVITALFISTLMKGKPATVVSGSTPLCASSIVCCEKESTAFIDYTIVLSRKDADFCFFLARSVSH